MGIIVLIEEPSVANNAIIAKVYFIKSILLIKYTFADIGTVYVLDHGISKKAYDCQRDSRKPFISKCVR